jgi:hypothetical protein
MITETQNTLLKGLVTDYKNPYFQHYIKSEMTPKHKCPICDSPFEEYINFRYHIVSKHPETVNTENIQACLNPLSRVRTACGMRTDTERLTMGKFFGDIITSTHNQHALINMIGKTGMGKSNAAMSIGIKTAEYIAGKMGGKPEDYFNIDNIAIMKLDSVIPIMEDLDNKRYNIIVLDDIGASYSARDFQKSINKNINKIFQTFRDTNTLVILTMPDTFLIDKVARKLAHFQIELVEKRHDQGVSIGKLVQLVEQYRGSGKTHFHFIVDSHGVKYPRVIFKRVNSEFANLYESKREEIRKDMMQNSIDAIRKCGNDEDGEKGTDMNELPAYQRYASEIDIELTMNPNISVRALGERFGISKDTADRAKKYVIEMRKLKAAQSGEVQSLI